MLDCDTQWEIRERMCVCVYVYDVFVCVWMCVHVCWMVTRSRYKGGEGERGDLVVCLL